ncbi:hypothetical protein BGZ94_002985 [Podila epigama]|nr:hypothetical protein BGZ94_002985 [Podila epigama]
MAHHPPTMQSQPHHYQPTPPYYGDLEAPIVCPNITVTAQRTVEYLATPRSFISKAPAPAPQHAPFPSTLDVVASDKTGLASAPVLSSKRQQQQQTVAELANFASHMVCFMVYGQQTKALDHPAETLPTTLPSSPLSSLVCDNNASCSRCSDHSNIFSNNRQCSPTLSMSTHVFYPSGSSPQQPDAKYFLAKNTCVLEKVQPTPIFRKFSLDVLSATLLSPSVILLALKYIQKLMANLQSTNKIVNTGDGAEYRFFTGALILANKFLDDNTFTNKTWADITGMKIKDINHLEMQFLSGIDFRLFTSLAEYSDWLAALAHFTSKFMPAQYPIVHKHYSTITLSNSPPVHPTVHACEIPGTEWQPASGFSIDRRLPPRQLQTHHRQPFSLSLDSSRKPYDYSANQSCSTDSLENATTSMPHYIDAGRQFERRSMRTTTTSSIAPCFSQLASSRQLYHPHPSQSQRLPLPPLVKLQNNSASLFPSSPESRYHGHDKYLQQTLPPLVTAQHRKRSAYTAFDERTRDFSTIEQGHLSKQTFVPSHKRFSSASSAATFTRPTSSYRADCSPPQNDLCLLPHSQQHNTSQPRSSNSQPLSWRKTPPGQDHPRLPKHLAQRHHHHQRSASGDYFMEHRSSLGEFSQSSLFGTEPVHAVKELGITHGQTPLHSHPNVVHPQAHPHSQSWALDSTTLVQGLPPCKVVGYDSCILPTPSCEVDPGLWGPLDSLSLYAITTQTAKRMVAQSKSLVASSHALSNHTSLAWVG